MMNATQRTPGEQCRKGVVTVLLSGGVDSAACAAFYLEQGFLVHGLFVDYGQAAARRESKAARAIAAHYNIPLGLLRWHGQREKREGLILGRNAFLIFGALMELPEDVSVLAIGVHSGTDYLDCSPPFVETAQSLIDAYTGGTLQLGVPFLNWSKSDIRSFCKSRLVPVELTYSCERGVAQPCGTCLSCRDLEALHACP